MKDILDDFQQVEPTDEMLQWRQFIGKNADFYIERWIRIEHGDKISFNITAFLFGVFWFIYRKMYLEAIAIMALFMIESSITSSFIGADEHGFNLLMNVIIGTLLGFTGNLIYYHAAKRKINKIIQSSASKKAALVSITKRGGTSILAVIIWFLIVFGAALLLVILPE